MIDLVVVSIIVFFPVIFICKSVCLEKCNKTIDLEDNLATEIYGSTENEGDSNDEYDTYDDQVIPETYNMETEEENVPKSYNELYPSNIQ